MPQSFKRAGRINRRHHSYPRATSGSQLVRFVTSDGRVCEDVPVLYDSALPRTSGRNIHQDLPFHGVYHPYLPSQVRLFPSSIQRDYRTPQFWHPPGEESYNLVFVESCPTNVATRAVGYGDQAVLVPSRAPVDHVLPWSDPTVSGSIAQNLAPPPMDVSGFSHAPTSVSYTVPTNVGTVDRFYSPVNTPWSSDPLALLDRGGYNQVANPSSAEQPTSVEQVVYGPVIESASISDSNKSHKTTDDSGLEPRPSAVDPPGCLVTQALPSPGASSDLTTNPQSVASPSASTKKVSTIRDCPQRSPRSFSSASTLESAPVYLRSSKYWGGTEDDSKFLMGVHSFTALKAPKMFEGIEQHILPDIRGVPLVVEIPRGSRRISEALMSDKSKTQSRWKLCKTLYIIMPSQFQVGLAATLAVPHGHIPLTELVRELQTFALDPRSEDMQVHFIGYASNFSDSNIYVRNDVAQKELPWEDISRGVEKIRAAAPPPDGSRQRTFLDLGFAGTQCVGRNARCDLGLSAPRMLVSSRDSELSRSFFSKTHLVDALTVGCDAVGLTKIPTARVKRWGHSLGNRNVTKVARLHETSWTPNDEAICSIHIDGQNGSFSRVSFCNRVFFHPNGQWRRQGAVMYMRRSIDDYEERRARSSPYLEKFKHVLVEDLCDRQEQTSSTLRCRDLFEIAEGLNVARVPCNAEVESYYQPFISCCNRLVHAFKLDELQLVSIVLAMAQSACSAAYALAATEVAIARQDIVTADVGWTLLDIIRFIDHQEPKPIKVPYRFNKYAMFSDEGEKKWLKHARVCLRAMRNVRVKTSSLTQADYNTVRRIIGNEIPGVGLLRLNHLVGISAMIGLVPLSLFSMVEGGADKAYKWMAAQYPQNVPRKEEYTLNIHHLIEVVMKRRVSPRYAENVSCKVGRVMSGSDGRFYDIIDVRFPLLTVKGNRVAVTDKKGQETFVSAVFDVENGLVSPNIPCKPRTKFRSWMIAKKQKSNQKK